jgi:hypothetical protein
MQCLAAGLQAEVAAVKRLAKSASPEWRHSSSTVLVLAFANIFLVSAEPFSRVRWCLDYN